MATPSSLIWLVTGRCNLACSHCYAQRFARCRELSAAEAAGLVEEAARAGVRHLGLAGGEPLLRPDIFDIIHRARSMGVGTSLVTNGALVTPRLAMELAREKVGVAVSLDGARPETHDHRRGTGSYDEAVRALSHLKVAGATYRTVLALGTDNYQEIEGYLELAKRLGAQAACLIPVMASGRARSDMVLAPAQITDTLKETARHSKLVRQPVELWCLPFAPLVDASFEVSVSYCRTSRSMDVDPSGNVLLCDVLDFVVSSARDKGLVGAWKDQCASRLVRRLGNPKLAPVCAECPLARSCRGGCFARAKLMSGDLYGPDPLCPRVADSFDPNCGPTVGPQVG